MFTIMDRRDVCMHACFVFLLLLLLLDGYLLG